MIEVKKITYTAFMAFEPIRNTFEDHETEVFEFSAEQLEFVKSNYEISPRHVWTLLDVGKEYAVIASGFHIVNRIGYMITKFPAPFEHCEAEVR